MKDKIIHSWRGRLANLCLVANLVQANSAWTNQTAPNLLSASATSHATHDFDAARKNLQSGQGRLCWVSFELIRQWTSCY